MPAAVYPVPDQRPPAKRCGVLLPKRGATSPTPETTPQKGERQGEGTARSAAVGAADVRLLGPT